MESFIDHFYVCEDLSKLGPLDIQRFATLPEAVAAYQALPGGKVKALGAQNTLPRPGSVPFALLPRSTRTCSPCGMENPW